MVKKVVEKVEDKGEDSLITMKVSAALIEKSRLRLNASERVPAVFIVDAALREYTKGIPG